MDHPFLENKNYYFYFAIWAAIGAAHIAVLYYLIDFPLDLAVADGIVFNTLFAALGLSYWFAIRFSSLQKSSTILRLLNHLVGGVLMVSFVIYLGNFVLNKVVIDQSALIDSVVPWKAFAGLFYYSITVLVYYLVRYYKDLQEKLNNEAKMETEVKQAELNMLKFQINPHFIFNSLNSVSALTLTRPESARDMLVKLSAFLRYSLGSDDTTQNTFLDELENIRLYLDIEKVRFGDKLNLEEDIDELAWGWKIPNMILQPLLENAIKYGVYESLNPVSIKLKAQVEGEVLKIEISNSYDTTAVPNKGEGIGLLNVSSRLQLIFGIDNLLSTQKIDNIFIVRVRIPK